MLANSGSTMNGRKMLTMPISRPVSVNSSRTGLLVSPIASNIGLTSPSPRSSTVQPNALTMTLSDSGSSSAATRTDCSQPRDQDRANAAG